MRPAPCSVDVCTTHRNQFFNLEVSTQHVMDVVTPFMLFGNINHILQPSLASMVDMWRLIINVLLDLNTSYDEVWWRTSPMTFYEVDLVHNVYYQYANVVITCINGVTSMSFEHRRTRVASDTVRSHLGELIEYVTIP